MRKVGLADIKTIGKWALPAGILTLGAISVIAAGGGPASPKGAVNKVGETAPEAQVTATPAPDASPAITINGVKIPTENEGTRDVAIPGGKAHVQVSGGQTKVTAGTSSGSATNQQTGTVNIHIDSHTSGTSSSYTTSSTSYTDTSVYSSGNTDVTVTR